MPAHLIQLERFGQLIPGGQVGIRINPGAGSGGNNRTNVGGPSSSFGIWHEIGFLQIKAILVKYDLTAVRIHTHIGSNIDPDVWLKVAKMNFDIVRQFPDVTTLNLGGGFKVGRMPDEKSTDLQVVGLPVKEVWKVRCRNWSTRFTSKSNLVLSSWPMPAHCCRKCKTSSRRERAAMNSSSSTLV